jgi:hypothetical protein
LGKEILRLLLYSLGPYSIITNIISLTVWAEVRSLLLIITIMAVDILILEVIGKGN